MKDRGRLDAYFARKDTIVARALKRISPKTGPEYRQSRAKRIEDLVLAVPLWAISFPIVTAAKIAIRVMDHVPPIYAQTRRTNRQHADGTPETMVIRKLRTMRDGSDSPSEWGKHSDMHDPAITMVGRIARRTNVDELPQLPQIIRGEMSFVGPRSTHDIAYASLQAELGGRFPLWEKLVGEGKSALLHPRAVYEGKYRKVNDRNRLLYDVLYARKASLGLDLYLLWRFLFVEKRPYREGKIKRGESQKLHGKTLLLDRPTAV